MMLMPVATLDQLSHHLSSLYMLQTSLSHKDIPPPITHILARLLRAAWRMLHSLRTLSSAELPQQAKLLSSSHKGMPHKDTRMKTLPLQLAPPYPQQRARRRHGNQVHV